MFISLRRETQDHDGGLCHIGVQRLIQFQAYEGHGKRVLTETAFEDLHKLFFSPATRIIRLSKSRK
jgi:hypothetical protein